MPNTPMIKPDINPNNESLAPDLTVILSRSCRCFAWFSAIVMDPICGPRQKFIVLT